MLYKTDTQAFRDKWIGHVYDLQGRICRALEELDGKAVFTDDEWKRDGGGGGLTKVMADGNVFEKGGVNTSVVWGEVTEPMRAQLKIEGSTWFACGISLVIHPRNPYVPTVHANWRYFELYDENEYVADRWCGGGCDLTPYYIFEEDARHFHLTWKNAIDPFGKDRYPAYKKGCDEYFVNRHRDNEMRGIGGVFYDYLRPEDMGGKPQDAAAKPEDAGARGRLAGKPEDPAEADHLFAFQVANGNAFLPSYIPIAGKRKDTSYGEREIGWQEIRRGRYVEFNLIHDRGTLFGLKTKGRTESILMSLPPRARWGYNFQPVPGTPEADLLDACLHPREWIAP